MNIAKLKGKFVENGKSPEMVAEEIGMSRSAMYRRLNKPKLFSIEEAQKIKEAVPLSDAEACEVFLT